MSAGGCALPWGGSPDTPPPVVEEADERGPANDFARSRLIAADFVDTLVQIPSLAPRETSLVTARPRSRFGSLLLAALQDAGYELRMVAGAEPGSLDYTISADAPSAGVGNENGGANGAAYDGADSTTWTFLVMARTVKLKRAYRITADGVVPASSMFVHGADPSRLSLDAGLFRPGAAAAQPSSPPEPLRRTDPSREASSPGPVASTSATPDLTPVEKPGTTPVEKRNVYDLRASNYAPILANYETLERTIMVFPNDSLAMGRANKSVAAGIAGRFDAARDVISVIGCSHGPSAVAGGNEGLANGRAVRVKEEFVFAGIDPEQVLEEGCWAGKHFAAMPARGVVVTHKRRAPLVTGG